MDLNEGEQTGWSYFGLPAHQTPRVDPVQLRVDDHNAARGWTLPAGHELIQQSLPVIRNSQQPDGRWASEDGLARDVHATLEALHVLTLCEERKS